MRLTDPSPKEELESAKVDYKHLCRGKSKETGELIQGFLFEHWGHSYILWGMEGGKPCMAEVHKETVGRASGLFDKNCNPIFEGDVVKALIDFGPGGEVEKVVTVTVDGFGINLQHWIFKEGKLPEIIGNIYEDA